MTPAAMNAATSAPTSLAAVPGSDGILELGHGFRPAKVLLSAVELGVFTALAGGPLDLDSLRLKVGVSERGARDFFDCLVALNLLERDPEGYYRNTVETEFYLDREKPAYVGGEVEYLNVRVYPHWHMLTTALRTGKPQSEASQTPYFSAVHTDKATLELFAKGMTAGVLAAAKAVAARFAWNEYRTMIDVGTAQGCLPVQIAAAHPHVTGRGFDLPTMRPIFERYVQENGFGDRLHFHAGDFLKEPLPSADVLVLGRVLHNWNLVTKKILLRKAYDALPTGGAVIILERLIDDERKLNVGGLLASLHMLIMTEGGFDFSAAECLSWMHDAGFRDRRVTPLTSTHSMIIGLK
jgi:hypothetical protein